MNCTQRVKKLYAVKHLLGEFLPVGRRKNELRNITHAKFNQRKYGQLPCDKCHSKPYPVSCHKCGSSGYIIRAPTLKRVGAMISQRCQLPKSTGTGYINGLIWYEYIPQTKEWLRYP